MIYILVLVFHINGGGSNVSFQEFNSHAACSNTRNMIYKYNKEMDTNLEYALCVPK